MDDLVLFMITDDDKYIYGCIRAGVPVERVAAKLCITPEEVMRRHNSVLASHAAFQQTGVEHLIDAYNTLCLQYNLLGEGLKGLSLNLCEPISPEEIRQRLTSDPDESVKNLMSSFIILRPFKAPEPPILSEKAGG